MAKLIIDFYKTEDGVKGGVQSLFDDLSKMIDGKLVSYMDCAKTLGIPNNPTQFGWFEMEGSWIIDDYIAKYKSLFGVELIIKNSIVGTFSKVEAPMIATIFDNNLAGPDALQNTYDKVTYNKFRRGFLRLQKTTCKASEVVVANSNHVKDCYDKEFGIDCEVIPSCVDTKLFKPLKNKKELRKKYGIPKNMPVCCTTTAFHPIKNWQFISQLIKDFKDDVFFVLIFKHQLPPQTRIKSKNVKIWFNMPREELAELYAATDFMIMPSLCEADNVSVKEAMACGIPILTSKVGQFWDFWDDKLGYRVDNPSDYSETKEKFGMLLKNYKKFKPRPIVCKNWGFDIWEKKWKKTIKGVL